MNKFYDRFERKVLIGNRKLQWLFESLHRFSLRGMNFGQVHSIELSGELYVIEHLQKKNNQTKSKLVLFDVGANKGEYSKILAIQFQESVVYSFEALSSTFQILLKNSKDFKNIICINKALGSQAEDRLLYSEAAGSSLATFYPLEIGNEKLNSNSIPVITIDAFCLENGIEQIDFLKIDVEGFEYEVLLGAERMINSGKILNIQFEFGGNHVKSGIHFLKVFQFLSNYNISRVLKNGLLPYKQYDTKWEIYLSANYLAELKNGGDNV